MRLMSLRVHAAFYRARWLISFLGLWFIVGLAGFRWGTHLDWSDALLATFYFEIYPGIFAQGYAFWGQSMLFGIVIGSLLNETLQNYVERCRLMAKLVKDHIIIVGYTNLGMRLVNYCIEKDVPYVLIEQNKDAVETLLRQNEPIIIGDARIPHTLFEANIRAAKHLVIATDNIETALITTKNARDANPKCKIATRCALDNLVEVFEQLGANHVYSTTLTTFKELAKIITNDHRGNHDKEQKKESPAKA